VSPPIVPLHGAGWAGCSGREALRRAVTAKRVAEGRLRGHRLPPRCPENSSSQNRWGRRAVVRAASSCRLHRRGLRTELWALVRVHPGL